MPRTPTLALLGGGFSDDPDTLLDDFVLEASGRPRPKVCFLPTASGDAPGYIEKFHTALAARACEPVHLELFRRTVTDLRAFVLSQDVVYVGGGNTANMLAVWRVHGHYDSEPSRRPGYLAAVNDLALPGGWALDDGAAALFTGGRLVDVVTRRPGATLRRVDVGADGAVTETARPARLLGT
ncbi:Type 1 glutamine amidotransferase-like domain-containing protein [Streptomyces angustmyceticus]|uniref:Putative peptidase YgaJ n=1 Tax=Streptomyces angustmyceticus TaxID=285578 RepID=A0A5J4LR53_9ACTN|nr:Type 1 glutamine amidotransferase-like domain-containing protein [Streptomyces angustmyceticus]UAL69858.1 Type 1 glutamine amidotransferase-like domain-containing protein [Streptomyces angustmyceticus]GES34472.1 putative peptidase YgaJ [Streptomyces angustmyceticus]